MKIICPKCGADYNISDSRLTPEGLQIKCPKCFSSFVVDGQGNSSPVSATRAPIGFSGANEMPTDSRMPPSVNPLMAPGFSANAANGNNGFYIILPSGHQVGPLPLNTIQQMKREGRLTGEEKASVDQVNWQPAKSLPALAAIFPAATQPSRGFEKAPQNSQLPEFVNDLELDDGPILTKDPFADDFDFNFSASPKSQELDMPPMPPTGAADAPSHQNSGMAHIFEDIDDLPAPANSTHSALHNPAQPLDLPDLPDLFEPIGDDLPGELEDLPAQKPPQSVYYIDPLQDLPGLADDLPGIANNLSDINGDLPGIASQLPTTAKPRSDLPGISIPLPGPASQLPTPASQLPTPASQLPTPAFTPERHPISGPKPTTQTQIPVIPHQPATPPRPSMPHTQQIAQPVAQPQSQMPAERPPLPTARPTHKFDMPIAPEPVATSHGGLDAQIKEPLSEGELNGEEMLGLDVLTTSPAAAPAPLPSSEVPANTDSISAAKPAPKRASPLKWVAAAAALVALAVGGSYVAGVGPFASAPVPVSRSNKAPAKETPKAEVPAVVESPKANEQEPAKAEAAEAPEIVAENVAADAEILDSGIAADAGAPSTLPSAAATLVEIAGYRERISAFEEKLQGVQGGETTEDLLTLAELYAFGSLEYAGQNAWAERAKEIADRLKSQENAPAGLEFATLAADLAMGVENSAEAALTYAKQHSEDARALYLAAHAQLISDDVTAALESFGKAAELDPNLLAAQRLQASLAYELGNYELAQKLAEDLYTKAPGAPAVMIMLAQFELRDNHFDRARKLIAQVLDLEGKRLSAEERSQALVVRAQIDLARENVTPAMADLEAAILAWPENIEAISILSERHFAAKNYEQALNQFESLRDAKVNTPELMTQIASCHQALGRPERALQILETASKTYADSDASTRASLETAVGEIYLSQQKYKQAEQSFEAALELDPNYAEAILGKTKMLIKEAKTPQAIKYLETAIQSQPNSAKLHAGLADLNRAIAETTSDRELRLQAVASYRTALKYEPRSTAIRQNLGELLLLLEDFPAAKVEFDELSKRPDYHRSLDAELGLVERGLGDLENAKLHLSSALARTPDDASLHFALGAVLFELGESGEAKAQLDEAERINPALDTVHYYQGRIALANGLHDEAVQRMRRALDADKGNNVTRYWLGRALEATGGPAAQKAALQEYDTVANACHKDPELAKQLCDVLYRRGEIRMAERKTWPGAKKDLNAALHCAPDHLETYILLGQLAEYEADLETAIRFYTDAISRNPEFAPAYAARASARIMQDKLQDARNDLQKAIQFAPNEPEPYYQLCAIVKDRDLKSARTYCKKYLELAPKGINADAASEIVR